MRTLVVLPFVLASTVAFATEPEAPAAPAETPKPTFADLDADKNGSIEKAEAEKNEQLAAAFASLDTDGNGALSAEEFAAWK